MEIVKIHHDIDEFVSKLDPDTRSQILRIVNLLGIHGYSLGMPYSKKIEKNLYELRIKATKNIRIFYTFHESKIIFLHIISKEKQKLSKNQLTTARSRLSWLH